MAAEQAEIKKPEVLEFSANWCESCQKLKPEIARIQEEYSTKVEFINYDIDDPSVKELMDQYDVTAVPTLIFLDSKKQISGIMVGFAPHYAIKHELEKLSPFSKQEHRHFLQLVSKK